MFSVIKKEGVKGLTESTEYAGKKALKNEAQGGGYGIYLEEERSICARFVNKKCKEVELL